MRIETVGTSNDAMVAELVEAFARLVPQLSSATPPGAAEVRDLLDSRARLLIARAQDGQIVGTLTLAFYRVPTGLKAWIEDVIVDAGARGSGLGERMTRRALEVAREHGAPHVDLTSRATREAANRLYQRIGFEPRTTNLYRFNLKD